MYKILRGESGVQYVLYVFSIVNILKYIFEEGFVFCYPEREDSANAYNMQYLFVLLQCQAQSFILFH